MTRSVYAYTDSVAYGGAERALGTLMVGLADSGWRPVLLHRDAVGLEPLLHTLGKRGIGERVVDDLPEGIGGAARSMRLIRLLRTERPDVFHAHQTWPFGCKWALAAACAARVPAVVATAQLFVTIPMGRSRRVQARMLSRRVDRVIAVSRETSRAYGELMRWPPDKLVVIPNAVEIDDEVPEAAVAAARAELDDGSGRPVALVPARLEEQKGHRYLLEAAVMAPELRFACVGDGALLEETVAAAQELGVAGRVSFLGFRRDVPALMRASDLVVLPSLYEGLPLSLIEAMVAGLPIVATDVGGTSELVIDGETGVLVPPGDSRSLAAAATAVAGDATEAAQLGAAGRERARLHFSSEAMVASVIEEYERILASEA